MRPDDEGEAWKPLGPEAGYFKNLSQWFYGMQGRSAGPYGEFIPYAPRKRPAELDDKDRKNPWGHIPFHN